MGVDIDIELPTLKELQDAFKSLPNNIAAKHMAAALGRLTSQMRLQWRSRTLDVVSVLEYGNRSEHVLICQEQVA